MDDGVHLSLLGVLLLIIAAVFFSAVINLTCQRIKTFCTEKTGTKYQKFFRILGIILRPAAYLAAVLAKVLAIPFGVEYHENEDSMTEEEIISMVDEAHEKGVIEENEAEMIQNIISFNETDAGEIMTHRKDIVAFEEEILLQEMVERMLEEGNSRYPVYRGDLDSITGVVHYKDALKFLTRNSWAKFKPLKELPGLIREAAFIPETRSIGDLFRAMQAKKVHMAIVVDEYGQTAGIVSMEDILEEIVGEILDEYDEDQNTFRTQKDNTIVIDALADLKDVEEKLDISFGDCEFETLNGVLTSLLGHIPVEKDLDKVLTLKGYRFQILSLGHRTIGKVKAEKIKEEKAEEQDTDRQTKAQVRSGKEKEA